MKQLAISNSSSDLELLGAAKSVVAKGSPEAAAALAEVLAKSGVMMTQRCRGRGGGGCRRECARRGATHIDRRNTTPRPRRDKHNWDCPKEKHSAVVKKH